MNMYFKTIALTSTPFIITMFFAYLVGSFLSVAWDPAEWTMDMRVLMSIFGMCFGGALYIKLRWERLV